ncbi:hypothetical protein PV646_30755 [Streptomyces sp. ID05-26A]|nr:hypothetical protein [Streptomyces sp. ID05-26A]
MWTERQIVSWLIFIAVVQAQATNDLLRPAGEQTRLRPPGTVERPFLCRGRPVGVASTVLVGITGAEPARPLWSSGAIPSPAFHRRHRSAFLSSDIPGRPNLATHAHPRPALLLRAVESKADLFAFMVEILFEPICN